jgi:lon-related putative ATP-dependent protease
MSQLKFRELPPEKLRWTCPLDSFKFKTTDELKPLDKIVGQDRALKAIKLGLDVESIGYNIFITGLVGTGRKTTIKSLLTGIRGKEKFIPDDICYVHNFKNPDQPNTLIIKAGYGRKLTRDMNDLIEFLKRTIPQVLESDEYQAKRKQIIEQFRTKEKAIISKFENRVNKESFVLIQIQMGPFTKPDIMPIFEGNPIDFDQLEKKSLEGKITKEQIKDLKEKYTVLAEELEKVLKKTRGLEKDVKKELRKLDSDVVLPIIKTSLSDIRKKYNDEKINEYLDAVKEDLSQNIKEFTEKAPKQDAQFPQGQASKEEMFYKYGVNVLVDNSETSGRPIILEAFPTYRNLFGTIERVFDRAGGMQTDFNKIKAGSFLKANGGYLVINAMDALVEPGVWTALKRTLKNRCVEIQNYEPLYIFASTALKPAPIDTGVKVVMVGDDYLYHMLWNYDEDFKKIFKIKADFDTTSELDDSSLNHYAAFIKKICTDEKLKPFDRSGVASIIEFAVRLAGRKGKVSTMFSNVADLIRESNYFAAIQESTNISAKHVDKAITEKIYRVNLIESKIKELIDDGIIMIDSKGAKPGQINGLAVYVLGDYTFGKPSRVTAQVSLGRAGIINIEREVELGGPTHNKGVMILSGYLRGRYGKVRPLTMSASICFEQSYGEVDGDSASSTELYAIISALIGVPIRQDLAVTGSVNQNGEVQAIGGVNEKIEGFFDVCRTQGLTGTQGVMIPETNVEDLMLRKDIVEEVKNGKFHIYPVRHIDEGISILTGIKAGKQLEDATFEPNSVNWLIEKKLDELQKKMKDFAAEGDKRAEDKNKK